MLFFISVLAVSMMAIFAVQALDVESSWQNRGPRRQPEAGPGRRPAIRQENKARQVLADAGFEAVAR